VGPAGGIAVALAYGWDLRRSLVRYEAKGLALGNLVLDQFKVGGTEKDDAPRDRHGPPGRHLRVAAIKIYIVSDPAYNAHWCRPVRDSRSS